MCQEKIDAIDIQYLKGVGPHRAEVLKKLGIFSIFDLLYYFPRDYDDRSNIKPISFVIPGERETVKGVIISSSEFRPRTRGYVRSIFKVLIRDNTGILEGIWFNQPYLREKFDTGKKVFFRGKIEINRGIRQINSPDFELIDSENDEIFLGIVPIYRLTQNITQKQFRLLIQNAADKYLNSISDFLPVIIRKRNNLIALEDALHNIHFPKDPACKERARTRLVFDELFLFEFKMVYKKKHLLSKPGIKFVKNDNLTESFLKSLPFSLTRAQKHVLSEIDLDLSSGKIMSRLLQGDVGSGKTILAIYSLVLASANNYQSAIMAPTEILAEQHFRNISNYLLNLNIKICLLISGVKNRKEIEKGISDGSIHIVVGTQALIQEKIKFNRLGMVVIDEQHRFGVAQRGELRQKGINPHILVMTATPIPRTLALTLYGDLDLSVIDELPPGRQKIITRWISESKRAQAYYFVRQEISKGNQVYFVYPLIEESENLDLKAASKMYENFKRDVFPDLRLGLLHGKMKPLEKNSVMQAFRKGDIQMLISTTVIEVGIDVPRATVMFIEHPERFGLAQLHQLRGRVGRSKSQSYCILLTSGKVSLDAKKRMEIFVKTQNGFELAEEDLKIRGPGEFFGTRQHGMPEFRIVDLIRDARVVPVARKEAFTFLQDETLKKDNSILLIEEEIKKRYSEKTEAS
ncbi:MAG: ATP-dependent DNA helicase RecG [bacterium]|nr:ATP-dependent DNA helicase RecG [bacterium]